MAARWRACLNDSLQVANCVVGGSFGNGSAEAADPIRIVRVPSRTVCSENLDAAERYLGPRIISE